MRKIFILAALFLVGSCKKGGPGPGPEAHVNTLSAHVDGVAYLSKKTEVTMSPTIVAGARSLLISAVGDNGRELILTIHVYDGTLRSYNYNNEVNAGSGVGCYSTPTNIWGLACAISGKLVLTSIDRDTYATGQVANGTFSFETDSTDGYYNVTDGNFSVFIPDNDN